MCALTNALRLWFRELTITHIRQYPRELCARFLAAASSGASEMDVAADGRDRGLVVLHRSIEWRKNALRDEPEHWLPKHQKL